MRAVSAFPSTVARGALVACAIALAILGVGAASAARAAPAPVFTLSFDALEVGVPVTETGAFTLDRDAELVAFAWLERQGVMTQVDLIIEACDSGGTCVDPTTLAGGVPFAAGTGTVSVTATLAATADPGSAGSVVGQLTFTAADDLAATGFEASAWLLWAVALVCLGVFAVLAVRGRRSRRGS
jgi:hypothetical protein